METQPERVEEKKRRLVIADESVVVESEEEDEKKQMQVERDVIDEESDREEIVLDESSGKFRYFDFLNLNILTIYQICKLPSKLFKEFRHENKLLSKLITKGFHFLATNLIAININHFYSL